MKKIVLLGLSALLIGLLIKTLAHAEKLPELTLIASANATPIHLNEKALEQLGHAEMMINDVHLKQPAKVSGTPLLAFLKTYPLAAGQDAVLVECDDGYQVLVHRAQIERYPELLIVTRVNGQ